VLEVTPTVAAVTTEEAFCILRLIFSTITAGLAQMQHTIGKVNRSGNGEVKIGSSRFDFVVCQSKPSLPLRSGGTRSTDTVVGFRTESAQLHAAAGAG